MNRIFITSALILACALIHAQHISEEDALAYASEFFQGRATSQLPNPATGRKIARKAPRLKVAASRDEFYIFNDEANDGFVNGDTEKIAFSTLPRARVNGGTPTEAGTYPIVVSGGVSDRYALTRVNGTLTVVAPDAIRSLLDSGTPFDVYNLLGKRLRTGTRSFKGLPSGIYIVNGQKVVVKSD